MLQPCKLIIPTSIRGNLGIISKGRSKASHPKQNITYFRDCFSNDHWLLQTIFDTFNNLHIYLG